MINSKLRFLEMFSRIGVLHCSGSSSAFKKAGATKKLRSKMDKSAIFENSATAKYQDANIGREIINMIVLG